MALDNNKKGGHGDRRVKVVTDRRDDEDFTIPLGVYRHYKGNLYEVIGFAIHSETLEYMVIYKALYGETLRSTRQPPHSRQYCRHFLWNLHFVPIIPAKTPKKTNAQSVLVLAVNAAAWCVVYYKSLPK